MNALLYYRPHPLYGCSVPQASFASCPATLITHLAIILLQVSSTSMGRTPGCLSRSIKRPSMSAWYAAHGGC